MKDGLITTCKHCGEQIRWTKVPSGFVPILASIFTESMMEYPDWIEKQSHAQWNETHSTIYRNLEHLL